MKEKFRNLVERNKSKPTENKSVETNQLYWINDQGDVIFTEIN